MSNDVGQDILKSVRADFAKSLDDQNSKLGKLFKKIQDGKANMNDISTFSVLIGQTVSSSIEKQTSPETLPNGLLYYNIAQTVLQGVLKDSYELINLAAQSVQERLDSEQGIHIKPVKPDFPEERIRDIAGAASTASMNKNEDKMERRLTSPVENVVQSFYSDYVNENADRRSKAGLNAYIVRRTNGRCCAWCSDLAGRYRYEDAPGDVYARHDNCTCTVEFVTDKYRQDVGSKRKYSLSPEERRRALEAAPKPTRYTREQAKNLQYSVMNRVAFFGGSGIIENKDIGEYEITITLKTICELDIPKVFSDERINERVLHSAKTVLSEAMEHALGTEVGIIVPLNNNGDPSKPIIGAEGAHTVTIPKCTEPSITIHNHPSGETFSIRDLEKFHSDSYCFAMVVIGNNGNIFTLRKQETYRSVDFFEYLYHWKYGDLTNLSYSDFLKGAEKYGVKYYE